MRVSEHFYNLLISITQERMAGLKSACRIYPAYRGDYSQYELNFICFPLLMLLVCCLARCSAGTVIRHKRFWASSPLHQCYQEAFSHRHDSVWISFNMEESPWMSQTIFTSTETGGRMIWRVTGSKKGVLKDSVLKDEEEISKVINKEAKSWRGGWHIWVKTTATIPVCMSGIRHSLGEKKGIEMEFEPSNCIFYLLFSVLLVQKEKKHQKATTTSFVLLC